MPSGNKIKYFWGNDSLQIHLGNRVEPRIKVLFWAETVFTVGWATIFLLRALPIRDSIVDILIAVGASLLYLLAAYRLLSRLFYSEKLLLNRHTMDIVTRTPFSYKSKSFEWRHMGPLHYVGLDKKTDHPLMGKCYDYFGFETREKLIHRLHNEGNLYFNYGGFPVRFGKGVYSWDAEEIVNMMQIFIGQQLRLGPEWAQMVQEHELDDYNAES